MTLHVVEFDYKLPEWGSMTLEMDETLSQDEKETLALVEIKASYSDIEDIEIENIKVID